MEALVCAFSELRIREDAVSKAQGRPGHPDATHPTYTRGAWGPSSHSGSKPKNFRLHHLQGLALCLQGHPLPAGQCESHWLGRLMAGGCLPQPEGTAWTLDLPQGTLGPGSSHCSALLEAQLPRDSLGNTASSSSMDPAKGTRGPGGALCPLCKRTHSGALERP
uniref:Chromosome 16 open reading frame 90 n=1 Tax=Aotus nancymaae TaxID=37293 RepID=A0A2K5CKT9_AOTNA